MNHHEYLDRIGFAFEHGVREVVTTLREPVAERPQAALKLIGLVVETIAGFAIGCACGEVERAARAWFGADAAATVRAGVPPPRRALAPGRPLAPFASDRSFAQSHDRAHALVDADRSPLVDELGVQLRRRLRFALGDLERFVAYVVLAMPRGRDAELAAMFSALNERTLIDERLRHELATAWTCACAAIEGAPLVACGGTPRSRALWLAWSKLARISREEPHAHIVAVG